MAGGKAMVFATCSPPTAASYARHGVSGKGSAMGWSISDGTAGAVMYVPRPYTDDSETLCAPCGATLNLCYDLPSTLRMSLKTLDEYSLGVCWAGSHAGAMEATETRTGGSSYVRYIKMHRTGGPGLANASQMPVNTGDSEGHPSLMEKHNTYEHSTSRKCMKTSSLSLAGMA